VNLFINYLIYWLLINLEILVMKLKTILFMLAIVLLAQCSTNESKQKPPLAQIKPVEDVYFGTKITDPYRYMENLQDSSVQHWFKNQAEYSRNILNSIPGRQELINMMSDFDKRKTAQITSLNITDNDRYFYLKTTPSDETGKLFCRDGFKGEEVLLFDPKSFTNDSTLKYVISSINPSLDGSKISFDLSPNGSETAFKLTLDVETKTLYSEKNYPCFAGFDMSWLPDNKSFFYNRLQNDEGNDKNYFLDSKVFLHVVGTDPNNDREVFSRVNNPDIEINPEDIPLVYYDKNSELLLALVWKDNNLIYYYSKLSVLKKDRIIWKSLTKKEDQVYNVYLTDKELYVYSPKAAPNFRILKTSLENPDLPNAEIVIPEDPQRKLTAFGFSSDGLYYVQSENGVQEKLFILPNNEKTGKEINLPFAAGSVQLKTKGFKFNDAWVNLSGWITDNQRYRYQLRNNIFDLENLSAKAEYPEYADLIVEELMVPSYDGIKVPLSLIYNKNIKKDGKNPVLILGYGAYSIPYSPGFGTDYQLWSINGGILAIAHVRGGGELGDKWYKGGFKTTKPNTWKDLIACSEYLIKEQYTSPQRIAINGGSAGGILIGRALAERPDLFAAAIPEVGMLNSIRLEETPSGPSNTVEFGTVKDSIECQALIEMDSYLHLKDGIKYPAALITAGMNDPRVIAWQPAKFAARLQAANASEKPVLFLVDYEAGHGIGNTKTKTFESLADILSFALWQTGHPDFQIK
jgi:prolyl oligopeptidase